MPSSHVAAHTINSIYYNNIERCLKDDKNEDRYTDADLTAQFSLASPAEIADALAESLASIDAELRQQFSQGKLPEGGSTVIQTVVISRENKVDLHTAALGDSYALLYTIPSDQSAETTLKRLNRQLHHADKDVVWQEKYPNFINFNNTQLLQSFAIETYGLDTAETDLPAFVINNKNIGRIYIQEEGIGAQRLGMTRALGDYNFTTLIKKPDIFHDEIPCESGKLNFLILASDGLFEIMNDTTLKAFLDNSYSTFKKYYNNEITEELIVTEFIPNLSMLIAEKARATICDYFNRNSQDISQIKCDDITLVCSLLSPNNNKPYQVAVFDGHGTDKYADYAQQHHVAKLESALTQVRSLTTAQNAVLNCDTRFEVEERTEIDEYNGLNLPLKSLPLALSSADNGAGFFSLQVPTATVVTTTASCQQTAPIF